jgi:hypothetical protein
MLALQHRFFQLLLVIAQQAMDFTIRAGILIRIARFERLRKSG